MCMIKNYGWKWQSGLVYNKGTVAEILKYDWVPHWKVTHVTDVNRKSPGVFVFWKSFSPTQDLWLQVRIEGFSAWLETVRGVGTSLPFQ